MKYSIIILYMCLIVSLVTAQVAEQNTQINPDTLTNTSNVADSMLSSVSDISQDSNLLLKVDSILDTTIESYDVNNDYVITDFINDERSFPQQDKYIDALKDSSSLTQLDSFPDTLNPGMLILRRQFAPSEYSLYLGTMSEYAKTKQSNFFIYNFPDSLSPKKVAILKFYDDKVINPNTDIVDVYFDNNHIYIPKLSKVYYHTDSTWKMITALNAIVIKKKTTGDVSIISNPVGASILIDGKATSSVTPYLSSGMKPGCYSVSVILKDYEKVLKNVEVKADTVTQVNFNLKSTIGLEYKFFTGLFFNPEYYINLFTEATDENWREGIQKNDPNTIATIPSNKVGLGGTFQIGYRLKNRLWVNGQLFYSRFQPGDYGLVYEKGIIDREYEKWVSTRTTSLFGIAAGVGYDVVRTPLYRFSFSIKPEYAYVQRNIRTFDSSITEMSISDPRDTNNILAYTISKTITKSNSQLSGSAFGADISIENRFFIRRNICIDLQLGFNSVIAPTLTGEKTSTKHIIQNDPSGDFGDFNTDSTWTEKIAALKGDAYGTGEVIVYGNPDNPNNLKKAAIELTKIFLRIGICFYF
jgi:hypothetical protein